MHNKLTRCRRGFKERKKKHKIRISRTGRTGRKVYHRITSHLTRVAPKLCGARSSATSPRYAIRRRTEGFARPAAASSSNCQIGKTRHQASRRGAWLPCSRITARADDGARGNRRHHDTARRVLVGSFLFRLFAIWSRQSPILFFFFFSYFCLLRKLSEAPDDYNRALSHVLPPPRE